MAAARAEPTSLLGDPHGQGGDGEGGRGAVVVGERRIGREELFCAAAAVAGRIGGASRAAIPAGASIETVVAIAGCLAAGVPGVAVAPDAGPAERDHLLRDSGAEIWLGDRPEQPLPGGIEVIGVDADERAAPEPDEHPDALAALVLYTSGTTGLPKGAVLSRGALKACIDGLADAWAWTAEDVLVHGLPLFHVHGLVLGMLAPLRLGCSVVHSLRPRPESYAAAVESHRGTLVFGVPTIWSRIAADDAAARAMSQARLLVSGSAALPLGVARELERRAGQMPLERYGMTETLITIAARHDAERRAGWVGTPIAGVETRVLDDDGSPVAADGEAIGDLQVRGATLFDGYLGNPGATAASTSADGWFVTGDIAAVDRSGQHRIVGRKSADLIKTGGYRVGAGEVESTLLDHPAVSEAAVVGLADEDLGQRIVAYVVADGAGGDELIDHVARTLSWHKRPREVRFVDSLPRNALGKVQKARLTEEAGG